MYDGTRLAAEIQFCKITLLQYWLSNKT